MLSERSRWRLLFAALATLLVVQAWRAQYNHDEIEHLHAAWLLAAGRLPFAHFLEQHHPTIWILFRPLASHVRSPHALIFAARLFDVVLLVLLLLTLQRLVRRLFPQAAPWAVLLAAGSFTLVHNMLLFRPDPLMNLLFYAGLLQWVRFLQEGQPRQAALAGLSFGASVAVLQKSLAVSGLVAVATIILLVIHGGERRRRLLVGSVCALGAAAIPLALLAGWAAAHGIWRDFWFWNYEFNRFFYTKATLSQQFGVGDNLQTTITEDLALWIFGLVGVGLWARRWWRTRRMAPDDDVRLTLLVVLVGYLISLSFNKFPFMQYFIVLLPLWVPFAAEVFTLRHRQLAPLVRAGALAMVAIAVWYVARMETNELTRARHEYVLAHTAPGDTIYVSPPNHPIFREDGSFFWYNGQLIGDACLAYERERPGVIPRRVLEDQPWQERPPQLVYLDPRYPTYRPHLWSARAAGYGPAAFADFWTR
jgi:hypothetical protein